MLSIYQFHNRWRSLINIQKLQGLCIKVKIVAYETKTNKYLEYDLR